MFQLQVTLTNENEGYRFSEWEELVDDIDTPGELYRLAQREYGRCQSKVYVDTEDGPLHIGWFFESRQRYQDTDDEYLRGAWITYRQVAPHSIGCYCECEECTA